MSIQTSQRKVTADFITEILSLPRWKSLNERIMVYANLIARMSEDREQSIAALTAGIAAKALKTNKDDVDFREACYRCNKAVHKLVDEDDEYIWNDEGTLTNKWATDHHLIAQALLGATPDALMPTTEPHPLDDYAYHREHHLINNRLEMHRADMGTVYDAMDVLYTQGYKLNPVILNLKNLPMDLNVGKNYAAKVIALSNSEAFEDEFFFKYTMDSRGRIYARSLIVQPQGASFDKAILNFSEAKPLGKYGLQALMIHYANCSGHDKLSFMDRIKWARSEGHVKALNMVECRGNWLAIEELIEDNKHGYEEYAAAIDYLNATRSLDPTTYESALVTHQDATNSGFQFGAALTGDRQTAEDVNITASRSKDTAPADLYKKMAHNLVQELSVTTLLKVLPEIDRKFCKKPIMVTGYGAGIKAVMSDIQEKHPEIDDDLLAELKPHVLAALEETASSMLQLTDVLRTHGQDLIEGTGVEQITWITPDGFKCIQEYRDKSAREVKLNKNNVSYLKLEKGEKDPIDESKMGTALPPNFIHSIDAQVLRTAAIKTKQENIAFCPIHDSFGTHAGSFFILNKLLKESFVETMNWPWYLNFCDSNGLKAQDIRQGDYEVEECLQATYMFS